MEPLLCKFQCVTDFRIQNMEPYGPRFEEIKTLTLEIGSKIPPGKHTLVLIRPFPPLGRPGTELAGLRSLPAEDIDSIWVFRKPDDGQWVRIEIRGKARKPNVFIQCEGIEGVPDWDGPQS